MCKGTITPIKEIVYLRKREAERNRHGQYWGEVYPKKNEVTFGQAFIVGFAPILNFYYNDIYEYISEMFEKRAKYPSFSFLQELNRSINHTWIGQMRNITSGINLEWMKQMQTINKSLIESITEPFSLISKLTKNFINTPKFRLNIYNDNMEQDKNDEKRDSN